MGVKRILKIYGSSLAIAYVIIGTVLWIWQERFMFHPASILEHTPKSLYQLEYRDLWIPVVSQDREIEKIHGWWIESDRNDTPVLLYFHHNAGNISKNLSQAFAFHRLRYSVVLIDYRSFGLSEGNFPSESQLYRDAKVTWDYLTRVERIPPDRIIIYGHSLGSAIAIDLAVQQPQAAALITHNAFTSIYDMSRHFGAAYLFPIDLMLRHRFESLHKIVNLKIPVLFIHGVRDPQIPARMSQSLFGAASEPKQLFLIPDAGHDNNMSEENLQKIGELIKNLIGE